MTVDTRLDVRDALAFDIDAIAETAHRRRTDEHGSDADPGRADLVLQHKLHLQHLISQTSVVSLVATRAGYLSGYLFASVVRSRQSEATGALFAYIEDFVVADPGDWWECGDALLASARTRLRSMGASRLVVINDGPDARMRAFLWRAGLTQASEWYSTDII